VISKLKSMRKLVRKKLRSNELSKKMLVKNNVFEHSYNKKGRSQDLLSKLLILDGRLAHQGQHPLRPIRHSTHQVHRIKILIHIISLALMLEETRLLVEWVQQASVATQAKSKTHHPSSQLNLNNQLVNHPKNPYKA